MKENHGEMLVKVENILQMTDCKHFRFNQIIKNFGLNNKKIIEVANCLIGIGGKNGCPKYCPLYEPN